MRTIERIPSIIERYPTRGDAEAALKSLRASPLDKSKVVLLELRFVPDNKSVRSWAERGVFRGALLGVGLAGALITLSVTGPWTSVGALSDRWLGIALVSMAGAALGTCTALAADALGSYYSRRAGLTSMRSESYALVAPSAVLAVRAQRVLERTAATTRSDARRSECVTATDTSTGDRQARVEPTRDAKA